MGIDSISIAFSGATAGYATYRPGDCIQGVMTLVIGGGEHKLSSVLVKVRGLAKSQWKTSSGSGKNRRTHTHSEELWLIREDIFFIRGPAVEALSPGRYQYPFSYPLRLGLPPTYKCQYGTISYLCKARAISHDLFSFNGKSETSFTVLPQLDLNTESALLAEPLTIQREAETSLFGHAIGMFTLTMSHQMCVGGQRIRFTIDGPERLFQKQATGYGVVKLKRCTECTAHSRRREEKRDVAMVEPGASRGGWRQFELVVPHHEGITISSVMCRIITVTYYIKIKSRHINITLPLVVGTIPRRGGSRRGSRQPSPRPTAPELQSPPGGTWGRSPRHSPAPELQSPPGGTWGRSPRHSLAPEQHSASAPVLAAPSYDPPPSYEQVMQGLASGADGGRPAAASDYLSEAQRRHNKEQEAAGFTHLGDL